MFSKKIFILIIFLGITKLLVAQSMFSPLGFVEEHFGTDNFSAGMGYTGISSLSRRNFSVINPALLTTVKRANFASRVDFGYTIFKDDTDSYTNKVSSIPFAIMYLPVTKGVVFGLSYHEKYFYGLQTAKRDSTAAGGDYIARNNKLGALNQLGFSLARKFGRLSLGVNASYNFGSRSNQTTIDFDDEILVDYKERKEYLLHGMNFSAGFTIPISKFSFGGYVSTKVSLHSNDTYRIEYEDNSSYDWEQKSSSTYDIPMQSGVGIGWDISKNIYVETNYRYTFWKDTNVPTMNGRNTNMISLGLSFNPTKEFFWKFPTRIGGYYRQLSCMNDGSYVDEKAITFGFDIPTLIQNQGRLSMSFAYGVRGSLTNNEYQDEFIRLSIGFTSSDWWRNPKDYIKDKDIPKLDPKYKQYWE